MSLIPVPRYQHHDIVVLGCGHCLPVDLGIVNMRLMMIALTCGELFRKAGVVRLNDHPVVLWCPSKDNYVPVIDLIAWKYRA
jgi:hypothetical protein